MGPPPPDEGVESGGMWRIQAAERALNEVKAALNEQAIKVALLGQQMADFIQQSRDRWAEDERARVRRQKQLDQLVKDEKVRREEWEQEQEKRTNRMTKVAGWALASLGAMVIGLLGNALLLLSKG